MTTLKDLTEDSTKITLSDKGRVISELSKEQDALYAESRKLYQESAKLTEEYQATMRKISNQQDKIAQKLAAISDQMNKMIK